MSASRWKYSGVCPALWGVIRTFENVLITPHNAGHTPEYFQRLADIVAEAVDTAEESGEWSELSNQVV